MIDTVALTTLPERIRIRLSVPSASDCWLWTGKRNRDGYGEIQQAGNRSRILMVHRLVYESLVGPVPPGMQLDHLCRVRNCVNPRHLEPVTSRENTLRGVGPTAVHARQTHCKRGHEFTPENTYLWRTSRHCRACRAARRKVVVL